MSNYNCSIYQIGAGIRTRNRGLRERRIVDPVKRLNAIARRWKQWFGENVIITWMGYRSEVRALVQKADVDIREYE